MPKEPKTNYAILAAIAIITLAAIIFFVQPKEENSDNRIANAVEEIGEGASDAADELRGERTTGEKIGDAVEDVGNDIKEAAE